MQNNLLKKIDFNIKAGSFVGICGERGAGKSTLFKLMMRLWDVQSGLITVGGHPVSYYNPVWLRSQVSLATLKFEQFQPPSAAVVRNLSSCCFARLDWPNRIR